MFTGIVQALGTLTAIDVHAKARHLTLDHGGWEPHPAGQPRLGDSICVSGVCLTVTQTTATTLAFDVVRETLDRTTLGDRAVGAKVNLEPAVAAGQPLGGHVMQGHVDGLGIITDIAGPGAEGEADRRVTIQPPADLMEVIVEKGSIAVDGVSLTVAGLGESHFEVALIPTTLRHTTLGKAGGLAVGARVNLEADIISKTVVHAMRRWSPKSSPASSLGREPGPAARPAAGQAVTMARLAEAGFVRA